MIGADISLLAAFVAGVFSVTSPCILPIIPLYLAHIAGVGVGSGRSAGRLLLVRNALAFVSGFGLIFVLFGAALGAAGAAAGGLDVLATHRDWIIRGGGVLLIGLGLYQADLIRVPFLDRERRLAINAASPGTLGSSFVVGITFGAGWSPCVGPILGAILTLAASQGSVERATLLLAVYATGLAVPFLALAFGFGSVAGLRSHMLRHTVLIKTLSGALMIGTGLIMVLGLYEQLFVQIVRNAPWTPFEPGLS